MNSKHLQIVILVIAIIARFFVAFWAYEANDNHSEVVQIIQTTKSFPKLGDCWECFQPPAFYKFHAAIGSLFSNTSNIAIHRQMQWVNFIFSLLWILVVFKFLQKLNLNSQLHLTILAFTLWQPRILSMSVQATNDSFVVLIGAWFILMAIQFVKYRNIFHWFSLILLAFAATIIKGNGILLFIAVVAISVLNWESFKPRLGIAYFILFFFFVSQAAWLGGYTSKFFNHGDPFITNLKKTSPPPFWEDEEWFGARAGIRSIKSGYLKFPYFSLFETPYQINDEAEFPIHRTNFWALLYGNFYHAQFHSHPFTWRMDYFPWVNHVARALFILGILPTLLLILGLFRTIIHSIKVHIRQDRNEAVRQKQVHTLIMLLFLVFVLKYSFDYRDFGNIKALFLFPAFLSFLFLFIDGIKYLNHKTKRSSKWLIVWLWLVNLLFLIDIAGLLQTLHYHYSLL